MIRPKKVGGDSFLQANHMNDDPDSPHSKRRPAGWGAFSISVLAHGIFILLAIFYFYKWIEPPKEKMTSGKRPETP